MTSALLPQWQSASPPIHDHAFRRWGAFHLHTRTGVFKTVIFSAFILIGLICYMISTPHGSRLITPSNWYDLSRARPHYPQPVHANSSVFPSATHVYYPLPTSTDILPEPPSPSLASAELTLEQVRDIVAPTRGFFTRDYSLSLGWNNVSITSIRSAERTESQFVDAVYNRCCLPSSRIAQSHLGYPFIHLRSRVRVPAVRFFFTSAIVSLQLSWHIAKSVQNTQLWSTRTTPSV